MPELHRKLIHEGAPWPPHSEDERLFRQRIYRLVFNRAQPQYLIRGENWKTLPVETYEGVFVKITALAYANLLFGEGLGVSISGERKEPVAALRKFQRESVFKRSLLELAISQSVMGRAYFKIRKGPKHSMDRVKDRVLMEAVSPECVFRLEDPGNRAFPAGFIIATIIETGRKAKRPRGYPKTSPDWNERFLQAEIHYPGMILHEAHRLQPSHIGDHVSYADWRIGEPVSFAAVYEGEEIPSGIPMEISKKETKTGFDDGPLVFEIDNVAESSRIPYADIQGSEIALRLIEDRISRDSEILNKHASPKLAVPPGVINDRGQITREVFDGMVFEASTSGSGLLVPQYITWEPKMEQSEKIVDRLLEMFRFGSGMTDQILGLPSKTGMAESGTSLRLRMIPTIAATNRKRTLIEEPLVEGIRAALALGGQDRALSEAEEVLISWRDGLPNDPVEEASVAASRSGNRATVSIRTIAERDNPDWSPERIDEEVDRILKDEKSRGGGGFSDLLGPPSPQDGEDQDEEE